MKDIELVTALSEQMDMSPHDVLKILSALYSLIGDFVSSNGMVTLNGVGQFEAKKNAERITANPINGKRYLIPPKLTPVFKPAASWKTYLKNFDEQ